MYNPKFDIDLKFGEVYEDGLKQLLCSKGKIEVKTERDSWIETGFHILSENKKVKGMICLPVNELKKICKSLFRLGIAKKIMGGDEKQSELLLIPINLLVSNIGKIF